VLGDPGSDLHCTFLFPFITSQRCALNRSWQDIAGNPIVSWRVLQESSLDCRGFPRRHCKIGPLFSLGNFSIELAYPCSPVFSRVPPCFHGRSTPIRVIAGSILSSSGTSVEVQGSRRAGVSSTRRLMASGLHSPPAAPHALAWRCGVMLGRHCGGLMPLLSFLVGRRNHFGS